MEKEIGGFFEYEEYHGREYHTGYALNLARNCLRVLIRIENIKDIWISRLNCSAVFEVITSEKVKCHFYNLDDCYYPVYDEIPSNSFVYVTNYYGMIDCENLKDLDRKKCHVILDNVQAFFQEPLRCHNTIYSCRKFFGVTDGAYLYSNSLLGHIYDIDKSGNRIKYLIGRYEGTAHDYYDAYRQSEERLSREPIKMMSNYTHNLMKSFNYDYAERRRRDNYHYLNEQLKGLNALKLKTPNGPFAYPLKLLNGEELRKRLIEKKIYIPILWPNVLNECSADSKEYDFANNVLPIPCDQRYGLEDMEYITFLIRKICEEVFE